MSRLVCVTGTIMLALVAAYVCASAEIAAIDERFQLAAENQHLAASILRQLRLLCSKGNRPHLVHQSFGQRDS